MRLLARPFFPTQCKKKKKAIWAARLDPVVRLSGLTGMAKGHLWKQTWLFQYFFGVFGKAVADGSVGQVLAGPLFLKTKTKFHFTEKSNK